MTDTLHLLPDIATLRTWRAGVEAGGLRLGVVPTMGNLHAGHISLITAARAVCDVVLATIFVNPLQFGANEDLERYPRTFAADCELLQKAGCDALFAPDSKELYPHGLGAQTRIHVPGLSELHCGQSRPGHFDGVCTVVAKLFNLTRPHDAWFGLKDYQQFRILSTMVDDLDMHIVLHGQPTIREPDGLAMSSRNGYLDAGQRAAAPALNRSLHQAAERIASGETDLRLIEDHARQNLENTGFRPDYVSICNARTLLPADEATGELVILAAAWLGNTRLIDNLVLQGSPTPAPGVQP